MAPKKGKQSQQFEGEFKKTEAEFGNWYGEVCVRGQLIEYYPIKGCIIYRPIAAEIWDAIKTWFDGKITNDGVRKCCFPLFVPLSFLSKEESHLEGFKAEVCWVTPAKDPNASDEAKKEIEEQEAIAIRPTSECVMYSSYAKWIRSHRDLPLRLNQWNNVVRWETTHTMPFIRGREFLWQEGHTAFATKEEAEAEVYRILDWYSDVYQELLAVPVRKGKKTEKEKFAGADYTTTVEAYVPVTGRSVQGGTSHHLGQHFSKMFDIEFESAGGKQHVFQNSWGLSTRSLGVMVMVHSDDKGCVLPPRVAPVQVVVIPVGLTAKTSDDDKKKLLDAAHNLAGRLRSANIRAELDDRDHITPGTKFNEHEVVGVPVRVELGPKDLANDACMVKCRHAADKKSVPLGNIETGMQEVLDGMHKEMFETALKEREEHTATVTEWEKFTPELNQRKVILAPWCNKLECEDAIKTKSAAESKAAKATQESGAKSLCIPCDAPAIKDEKCIVCGEAAQYWVLWGRAY